MNVWTIKANALRYLILYLITGTAITFVFNYAAYLRLHSSMQCPELREDTDFPAAPVADIPAAQVEDIPAAQLEDEPEAQDQDNLPLEQPEEAIAPHPPKSSEDCIISLSGCLRFIHKIKGIQPPKLISFEKETPIETNHPTTKMPYKVPNIVHVIRFRQQLPFKFFNYVAFKSYDKYIKPHAIFLWGDSLPEESEWWERTVKEVPNIYYVHIKPKSKLGGEPVKFVAHASDYLRLDILHHIGGLYFDTDTIVLKSFDNMRVFELALGRATKKHVSNGIMSGMRGGQFVKLWMESYNVYQAKSWATNSVGMAAKLAELFPHLVHIEPTSFNHPTWEHMDDLYKHNYNISENYSLHLYWWKLYYIPDTEAALDGYDCTVGEAMRKVLYDSTELRNKKHTKQGYQIAKHYKHETFKRGT